MEMELLRPDQFWINFPAFALLDATTTVFITDGRPPSQALIILTDEDLLDDCRTKGYTGGVARLNDLGEILDHLETLPDEVQYIHLDPSDGKPKMVSIEVALTNLLKRMQGPQ